MNKLKLSSLLLVLALSACNQPDKDVAKTGEASDKQSASDAAVIPAATDNPFFSDYQAPYGIPPFDKIKNEHFAPAFKQGLAEAKSEIIAIAETPEPATFEKTTLHL